MKLRVLLAALALVALGAAGAAEATTKLPLPVARDHSRKVVSEWCERDANCEVWEVSQCIRFSKGRVDCAAYIAAPRVNRYCTLIVVNKALGNSYRLHQGVREVECGNME